MQNFSCYLQGGKYCSNCELCGSGPGWSRDETRGVEENTVLGGVVLVTARNIEGGKLAPCYNKIYKQIKLNYYNIKKIVHNIGGTASSLFTRKRSYKFTFRPANAHGLVDKTTNHRSKEVYKFRVMKLDKFPPILNIQLATQERVLSNIGSPYKK